MRFSITSFTSRLEPSFDVQNKISNGQSSSETNVRVYAKYNTQKDEKRKNIIDRMRTGKSFSTKTKTEIRQGNDNNFEINT